MKVLLVGELCKDTTYYCDVSRMSPEAPVPVADLVWKSIADGMAGNVNSCLLYTSPSPRDLSTSRMPSSA